MDFTPRRPDEPESPSAYDERRLGLVGIAAGIALVWISAGMPMPSFIFAGGDAAEQLASPTVTIGHGQVPSTPSLPTGQILLKPQPITATTAGGSTIEAGLLVAVTDTVTFAADTQAFYGAYEWGATATFGGNCDRSTIHVLKWTSLSESNAVNGSLYDIFANDLPALPAGELAVVMADTAGTVVTTDTTSALHRSCTILTGITANGGFTIHHQDGDPPKSGLAIGDRFTDTRDVIVRDMQVCTGTGDGSFPQQDAITVTARDAKFRRIIFDHNTGCYTNDEVVSPHVFDAASGDSINRIGFQRNIFGFVFAGHATTSAFEGDQLGVLQQCAFHQNVLIHPGWRLPNLGAGVINCPVFNNVYVNYGGRSVRLNEEAQADVMANYWILGPRDSDACDMVTLRSTNQTGAEEIFVERNLVIDRFRNLATDSTADQWACVGDDLEDTKGHPDAADSTIYRVYTSHRSANMSEFPDTMYSAAQVADLLDDTLKCLAGACRYLGPNGDVVVHYDSLEIMGFRDWLQGAKVTIMGDTAPQDYPADQNGYVGHVSLPVAAQHPDTDGGGIFDGFEDLCGLNKNDAADDTSIPAGKVYSWVEIFIHAFMDEGWLYKQPDTGIDSLRVKHWDEDGAQTWSLLKTVADTAGSGDSTYVSLAADEISPKDSVTVSAWNGSTETANPDTAVVACPQGGS